MNMVKLVLKHTVFLFTIFKTAKQKNCLLCSKNYYHFFGNKHQTLSINYIFQDIQNHITV